MSIPDLKNKRIADLVDQNYVHAYVLSHYGIHFYNYSEETLEQACREKGLKVEQVIRELETSGQTADKDVPLTSFPVDLIIEYLKHSHYLFIKHKLPYISKLVENFKANDEEFTHIERDLKIVFPLFVEEFIHHIYEEEDTLFDFILTLDKAIRGKFTHALLYQKLERHSIQKFAIEHEAHDDEMEGIRKITSDYYLRSDSPLHIKVLYNELSELEKSLITHARIENEILFPKGMDLEGRVRQLFADRIRSN